MPVDNQDDVTEYSPSTSKSPVHSPVSGLEASCSDEHSRAASQHDPAIPADREGGVDDAYSEDLWLKTSRPLFGVPFLFF